jgi:hypothetical protein
MKDLTNGSIAKNILQMEIASVTLQACISLWLVRGEFRQRLDVRAGSVAA